MGSDEYEEDNFPLLNPEAEVRRHPEQSVEGILAPEEWRASYVLVHRTTQMPASAPSLGECVKWIGQLLGGFLGRKGDREPGIQTLWRGFHRVRELASVWELMQVE